MSARRHTGYYPTYRETDETSLEWHDWLTYVQSGEECPSELSTITDVCASARCKAELRDEAGWLVGRVAADGTYRLG